MGGLGGVVVGGGRRSTWLSRLVVVSLSSRCMLSRSASLAVFLVVSDGFLVLSLPNTFLFVVFKVSKVTTTLSEALFDFFFAQ